MILGIRDYEKVLGDAHAQTMQHAMRSFNTLLFVGCGEGLLDPNFGALLQWSAKVFAGSEYRHFRLARDGNITSLQAQHPPEQRVFVLGYGPDHSDLAVFLRRVRPAAGSKPTQAERFAPARPAILPPAPPCFGRDTEVNELVATLLTATPEPVPILGPPGIGKSTITLVALNDARVAARYGQRRVFVRCDAIRTREALAAEIATALGLPLGPHIEAALIAELASVPTALAVDNAETPWEADTLRVEEFLAALAGLPGLALIASLRGASRPVGVPWLQPLQPPSLPLPDARKVFLAIAGDNFAADPLLDQVLLVLDGVPLAITLMAGAAEGQPDLDGTWRRWQDERTNMLQRASATHRLLNIEVSYEISIQGPRMTDQARRLLSLLSFLPGGVAHGDLDAVSPGEGVKAATILRQVGLAFDQERRLRLLAPLREYVQRVHPPPSDDQLPALSHYLELANSLGEKAGREGGAEAIARLTPEVANIEVAVLRGLDESAAEMAIRAALSFGEFARFTGLGTTAALERAAMVAQTQGAVHLTAQCLFHLGAVALARSDHDAARTHYEAARPLFQRVGDLWGEATCILGLGEIALRRSDHDAARTHYEAARPLYQRVGDPLGEASCVRGLGDIAVQRFDHDTAHMHYEAARPLFKSVGSILGEANCVRGLGDIALHRSDYDTARMHYDAAQPLFKSVGAILGEAYCVQSLGDIALRRSDYDAARTLYGAALPIFQRVGDLRGEANCIRGLGDIALRRSDYDAARTHFDAARPLYQHVGDLGGEAYCVQSLGDIALRRSDYDAARTHFDAALAIYERIPEPHSIATTHIRLASIAADDERRRHIDDAKEALQSIGRGDLVAELIAVFGGE